MLSSNEINHFRTFGFHIVRNFFSDDELELMTAEYQRRFMTSKRFTHPDEPPKCASWPNLDPETPFLAGLLEDPRINEIMEQLFGHEFIGISSNAGSFVHETHWHPDNADVHMLSIRLACYLQPLDAHNGALRLIPGSHKNPLHDALKAIVETPGLRVDEVPAYACRSEPGDMVVFDQRLWHASCHGSTDRHLVTLQYYKDPKTEIEKQLMAQTVVSDATTREALARDTFDSPGPEYHPDWVANPQGSAKRQRWIDWLRDWGFIQ